MASTTATATAAPAPIATPASIALKGTRSVKATLNYLHPSVEKPYIYLHNDHPGEPDDNLVREPIERNIVDLSSTTAPQREQLGLNVHQSGFEVVEGWGDESSGVKQAWADRKWDTDPTFLESEYYHDIDALLKRVTGATSTFIFDHTVRKRRTAETANLPDTPENRQPVQSVHSDQSRWAGENRIRKHAGDEMLERVKKGEVHAQLINVWRPLRGNVVDCPLAFADSRTVQPGDWTVSELRYKDWTGQTLQIHHNPTHQWYYYHGISPDQAILLKCYDSVDETRTPHTAFVDPTTPKDAEPRWSVEIRALVFTDFKLKEQQAKQQQAA